MSPAGGVAVDRLDRGSDWARVHAVVLGLGPAGFSAADNLLHLGARLTVLLEDAGPDEGPDAETEERAELLAVLGADVRRAPEASWTGVLGGLDGPDLVVAPPRFGEDHPVVLTARAVGLPVWGEVDLAWRLRTPDAAAWLVVAGQGRAAVVAYLEAMLRAAGLAAAPAAGDVGLPPVEVVMDPAPYVVLPVGLSADQLARAGGLAAESAAVLSADGTAEHRAHLGRAYEGVRVACVYHRADAGTEELVREADVVEGARAIGVGIGVPSVGDLGLVEELLADRAFVAERRTSAAELGTLADLPDDDPARLVAALAAAALARAVGVDQAAVREGLRTGPADLPPDPVDPRG